MQVIRLATLQELRVNMGWEALPKNNSNAIFINIENQEKLEVGDGSKNKETKEKSNPQTD